MKKLSLCCYVLVWIFTSFGTAFADGVDLRKTVESLNAQWNDAFNNGDTKALASLYADDATIAPRNGKLITGRANIESFFAKGVAAGIHNHAIEIVELVGGGDFIHETAEWSASGAEKDGVKPSFGGVLGIVFRQDGNNDWRIQTHIWNLRTD